MKISSQDMNSLDNANNNLKGIADMCNLKSLFYIVFNNLVIRRGNFYINIQKYLLTTITSNKA